MWCKEENIPPNTLISPWCMATVYWKGDLALCNGKCYKSGGNDNINNYPPDNQIALKNR